jgi:RNA-directed DNA polymerase
MIAEIADLENLKRAFHRVESARGPAGVDGVSPGSFRRNLDRCLLELSQDLEGMTYAPLPLLRILFAGADGSPKALFIPSVQDRTAQAAVMNVVEPILDSRPEDARFAHRTTRCVRHAAHRVKDLWESGYTYVVNAGIDRFFEGIDQELVMKRVEALLEDAAAVRLIGEWVRAEVYDGEGIIPLEKGIPLGSVIAHLLSNLLLDLLDENLLGEGMQLVRYGDDLVVLAREPGRGRGILEVTTEVLAGLQLTLDPEGSQTTDFWNGLKHHGFLFSGDLTLAPFDRSPRVFRILRVPPPFDVGSYLAERRHRSTKPQRICS